MNIQSEADLVTALAIGLKKKFKTDIVVQEFSAGYGIADLAFAKNLFTDKNLLNRIPINNYYALKSYLLLPKNQAFSVRDIMKVSGTSKVISQKIINSLLKGSYIYQQDRSYFKINDPIINPIKNLIAIEAKLKDWKQGIVQARRYKSYTDECYLAILAKYEKNIDLSYLKRFGIGLILFDQNSGEINIKMKPVKNTVLSFYEDVMGLYAKELFLHRALHFKNASEFLSM